MLTGQKILEYLAKQCSLPDVESSSHWDYYHRNFSFENENFFGLEVFLNDDKVTLSQENITSKSVKINDVIKVYDNKKLVREMLMNDERQFGSYYENGVLL